MKNNLKTHQSNSLYLLLIHPYSKEEFIIKTTYTLKETLDILIYIQFKNEDINKNVEISIYHMCKILEYSYGFNLISDNLYESNYKKEILIQHNIKNIKSAFENNKYFNKNTIYVINLFLLNQSYAPSQWRNITSLEEYKNQLLFKYGNIEVEKQIREYLKPFMDDALF